MPLTCDRATSAWFWDGPDMQFLRVLQLTWGWENVPMALRHGLVMLLPAEKKTRTTPRARFHECSPARKAWVANGTYSITKEGRPDFPP